MADDYKYKDLPRAANGIAPAEWDENKKEWVPFEGDSNIVDELESIKATQDKILERLDEPIDTQVTGSNVEEEYLMEEQVVSPGSQRYFDFTANPSFRIIGRLHNDVSKPWSVRLFPELEHFSFPYASNLLLIESKDGVLTVGEGSRSASYTNILNVISKNNRIYIYNNSDVELTFSLVIIKYAEVGSSLNEF